PVVREQQGVVHFGPLGLGRGDDEAVSLGRFVGIGPMWLRGGDHGRRLERRRGTYRHAGASIAHLETEYGVAGRRKRRYQSDEILRGFGQAELVQGALEAGKVARQEWDASLAHAHGLDETVPGLV